MFALKVRTEFITRLILIAVILFNALVPTIASASSLSAEKQAEGFLDVSNPSGEMANLPATTVAALTATPVPLAAAVTPSPETKTPILSLVADPDYLTANSKLVLTWTIEGVSIQDYKLLLLQITLPEGLSLQDGYEGKYDESTRLLTIPVTNLSGQVILITGATVSDVKLPAVLMGGSETLAENVLLLAVHEEYVVTQKGGEVIANDGKITVTIPADTFSADTSIDIGQPSGDALPATSLIGESFEISAKDQQSKTALHQFAKEIEIEVSYADLNIPEEKIENLFLYWYNPDIKEWEALPSSVNPKTKTLRGTTDHFSVFSVGVNKWQAAHVPTVDDFQVAGFTGAATYSTPIEVPAGPGGLQPSLTLSYNSQVVDQATTETQASWVGMGWSLDPGSIEMNTADTPGSADDTYSVNVGGISSRLIIDGNGVYHSADENFWKFDFNGTTWTVHDKVGNTYYFEDVAKLYYALPCQNEDNPGGKGNQTYKWVLKRVTNIFLQELRYEYEWERKDLTYQQYSTGAGHCNTYHQLTDTALFPKSILYPNGRYRIYFERESRQDYSLAFAGDAAHHSFETSRLKYIYVQYATNGVFVEGDPSQTVRKYQFTYDIDGSQAIFPGYTYTAGGRVSTLTKVEQFGVGGAGPLPAHTFTYGDHLHLTQATNGYGGTVEFDYDDLPSQILYQPWYYTQATIKDYTILDDFGTSHTPPCQNTGWTLRDGVLAYYNCNLSDISLQVQGTAIHNGLNSASGLRLIRPGGVYRLTTTAALSAGISVYLGAFDGVRDNLSGPLTSSGNQSYEFILPADASVMRPLIKTTGGTVTFPNIKMETAALVLPRHPKTGIGWTKSHLHLCLQLREPCRE